MRRRNALLLCCPLLSLVQIYFSPSLPPSKSVFFGHLTSGIVLSEQENASALSQEKWRSGMRGSYVSMHARDRRGLAARIPGKIFAQPHT